MRRGGSSKLTDEDRILWNRVARTAVPLKGRASEVPSVHEDPPPSPAEPSVPPVAQTPARMASPPVARMPPPPRHLDRPVHQKLVKGQVGIDASVDLHGMTQAEAHRLLLSFLHQAHAVGMRHVLVITGKGSSSASDGVLKRSVPGWFSTGPFRMLVSGYDEAGRRHGGGGALYVRLRRPLRDRS